MNEQTALQAAINYLGAVDVTPRPGPCARRHTCWYCRVTVDIGYCVHDVAPGESLRRWAYRDPARGRYCVVNADDLAALGQHLVDGNDTRSPGNKHLEWRVDTYTVEMAAWWKPEQQYAWRVGGDSDSYVVYTFSTEAFADSRSPGYRPDLFRRVTASLQTGEEVPA